MVMVTIGKHTYSIDGYHKSNLDALKHNVKMKYDAFILYVGREGAGKTTMASQDALYCDSTFNLDRVVFNIEQFKEAVKKATKCTAIVFDETMGYLSNRQSMSRFNRELIKIMSEIRSKQLYIFLCIPNFFIMDWYISLHRTTGLIYIYQRGRFGSYDYPTKKRLWIEGRRNYSYNVSPNFIGRFTKFFPFDWGEYEKKKQRAIHEWKTKEVKKKGLLKQRNRLIKVIFKNNWMTIEKLSKLTDIGIRSLRKILRKYLPKK